MKSSGKWGTVESPANNRTPLPQAVEEETAYNNFTKLGKYRNTLPGEGGHTREGST